MDLFEKSTFVMLNSYSHLPLHIEKHVSLFHESRAYFLTLAKLVLFHRLWVIEQGLVQITKVFAYVTFHLEGLHICGILLYDCIAQLLTLLDIIHFLLYLCKDKQ